MQKRSTHSKKKKIRFRNTASKIRNFVSDKRITNKGTSRHSQNAINVKVICTRILEKKVIIIIIITYVIIGHR